MFDRSERMGGIVCVALFAALSLFVPSVPAVAEEPARSAVPLPGKDTVAGKGGRRIALVIGNSKYEYAPRLRNPENDARLMAKALADVGFEVMEPLINATEEEMEDAQLKFGRALREEGVEAALFYYAGHGVQDNDENYLIPVGADIAHTDEISMQSISVNSFLRTMNSAKTAINIVILDACRNNPFAGDDRASGGGLALVKAPKGMYIAYSTAPGAVASDGSGSNSPYTEALAAAITVPGRTIEAVFKDARGRVAEQTRDRQVPWDTSSITGDFYFSAPASAEASGDETAFAWTAIQNSTNIPDFQIFLDTFGDRNPFLRTLAEKRIVSLREQLTAAVAPQTGTEGPSKPRSLTYCSEGSPEGFDPALFTSGTTFDASSRTLYSRLVEYEPGSTEVRPGLAESWEVSADGLTYTFHLRPGVKFHTTDVFTPTRDLNADDVLFSFQRQMNVAHPWHAYLPGTAWEYFNGMDMPTLIQSIEKVDDLSVRFTLTQEDGPFLAGLAMDYASIVSKEYADTLEARGAMHELNDKPVGTGPFILKSYEQDSTIRYTAHPGYWGGRQKIDDLTFAITFDHEARVRKLKASECDVIPFVNVDDLTGLISHPTLSATGGIGLNIGYLAFNTTEKPFDNPDVRKAISLAIDRRAIIRDVFNGTAIAARNPIPPTIWAHDESAAEIVHDPVLAKKLLDAAGVRDLKMKVWVMPVARPYMPNARRAAELIEADLAAIGVEIEVITYEWAEYLQRSKSVDRDGAVMLGWTGDNGDPDNFLRVLLSCEAVGANNRAQWCNEEFDRLVDKARRITDQDERATLYKRAQEIFRAEMPWVPLVHSMTFVGLSKRVTGYTVSPLGHHSFEGVGIVGSTEVARQ